MTTEREPGSDDDDPTPAFRLEGSSTDDVHQQPAQATQEEPSDDADDDDNPPPKSQASRIIEASKADGVEFFHSRDGAAFGRLPVAGHL